MPIKKKEVKALTVAIPEGGACMWRWHYTSTLPVPQTDLEALPVVGEMQVLRVCGELSLAESTPEGRFSWPHLCHKEKDSPKPQV